MGKSITPKYVVVIDGKEHEAMAWNSRQSGRPTDANLCEFVRVYGKSFELGQCNEHISMALGFIPYPSRAYIRPNSPGAGIVASWKAGMFQVW